MKDLLERALNRAQVLGASYADIRVVHRHYETVTTKDGRPDSISRDESRGFGVRVLVEGAWGFASSSYLTAAEVDRVTALAVEIAKASLLSHRDGVAAARPTWAGT